MRVSETESAAVFPRMFPSSLVGENSASTAKVIQGKKKSIIKIPAFLVGIFPLMHCGASNLLKRLPALHSPLRDVITGRWSTKVKPIREDRV